MEIKKVREDFPLLKHCVYLDAASTTPTPKCVVQAMNEYFYTYNTNVGRGVYSLAVKATEKVEEVRKRLGDFINSPPENIVFTKNTTEAINLVANGLKFKKGDTIIVPNIEHHSNFLPWLRLRKEGVNVKIIKAEKNGIVDPSVIEDKIDENTKLITVSYVSNVLGVVQDIEEIGKIAKDNDILYMVDAAQAIGHIKVDVKKINADFVAFPGHKGLLGPVGTGFLYSKLLHKLEPFNIGGGTVIDVSENKYKLEKPPARFEAGTLNIAGIIGLGSAVSYLESIGIKKIEKYCMELTEEMYSKLSEIDKVICYGDIENIHGIVSFNVKGKDPNKVARLLDKKSKICVRSGHHCAIPLIKHIGAKKYGGTVRASVHCYNNFMDIEKLINTIKEVSV